MARAVVERPIAPEQRLRMSYDEWHRWLEEEGNRGEWVDGEVIVFEMPKIIHQAIVVWLVRLLGGYVEAADLGQLFDAGTELWLPGRRTARLPDILFVATASLNRLDEDRLNGPADLVVELVSNDSVTRDGRDKFEEYQRVGIPEYWLFDPRPNRQTTRFFLLGADGRYEASALDDDGHFRSHALPGLRFNPSWLWQEPLPKVNFLLAQLLAEVETSERR